MKQLNLVLSISALFLPMSCGEGNMNFYYPIDSLVSYFPFEGNLKDAHGDTPEGTKSEFGVIYENGRVGQAV